MIWMQRIALITLLLLLGLGSSWAQGVYNYRPLLKANNVTERLNPCYWFSIVDSVNHGQIDTTKPGNGKLDVRYTPDSAFLGYDTLVVKYENMLSGGKIVYKSFVYHVVNSGLVLENDFITTYTGSLNVSVLPLLNDSSSIVGSNKWSIKSLPAANNLLGEPGIFGDTVKFSTKPDFEGSASITYRVCDSYGLCKDAVINISILDTNNLKVIDTINLSTAEDVKVQILLPGDGFSINKNAKHGKLDLVASSFIYAPHKDYNGKDTFKLVKNNLERLVLVTVIPQDEPNSIIISDAVYTPVDQEITFDVSKNDVTALVKLYSIGIDKNVTKGTLTKLNNQGLFKYVPEAGYNGVQTFSYKVCPQGICESATVKLYIGDYEPKNDDIYAISTYKNTPVLLSYQVPVDAYSFSSTSDSVKFYPGWDTVQITYNNTCSATLIGFNQLIYYPFENTIYTDTFKISYCVTGTNNCIDADIEMTVMQESKNCVKQCVGDCVWPGDVDLNGCVDIADLLSMACELGKTGPQRAHTGNVFRSHTATNWGDFLMNSGVDLKNADCNGDSIINLSDTLAIFNSYKKTHSLIPEGIFSKGDFPIEFVIQDTSVDIGDIAMVDVIVGSEQDPAVNIAGYSYNLDYNTDMVDENSLYVSYYEQDWFGRSGTLLNMFKKPWDGRLESGFVRANNAQISGHGKTEVLVFIVEDDLAPWGDDNRYVNLKFNNIFYQNGNGERYSIENKTLRLKLPKKSDKNNKVELDDKKLLVYPNPASEFINLHMNGKNEISAYSLFSVEGKEIVRNSSPNTKDNIISTLGLSNGIYILVVDTPVGRITKKIEIVN